MIHISQLVLVASVLIPIASAHAQSTHGSLDFAAPSACPDADRFRDEVAARLGRDPFTADGPPVARVRVFADSSEYVAMIERDGANSRSFRGADCAELIATAASALATQIDSNSTPTVADSFAIEAESSLVRLSARDLMLDIDRFEAEFASLDTTAASALLVTGVVLTSLSVVVGTTFFSLGMTGTLRISNGEAMLAFSLPPAIVGVTGVSCLIAGAAWLPSINGRRAQLQRRIDDRRELLDRALSPSVALHGSGFSVIF